MHKSFLLILFLFTMNSQEQTIIYDFTEKSELSGWRIVDDGVMGGLSQGRFGIHKNGNAVFFGLVSLENNGGFSSIRYNFKKISLDKFSKIVLRVKGDAKTYQFRIKRRQRDYYSYVKEFQTTKDWSEIKIDLSEMYPVFRGRKLAMDNFSSQSIEEIGILISNKKNENFKLEIDKIYLE